MGRNETILSCVVAISLAFCLTSIVMTIRGCSEAHYQAEMEVRKAYAEAASNGAIIGDAKINK